MSRRVVLLIPDAGPLISLAKADRLGLLLALGLPVVVADHVVFEATRDVRHEDARRIAVFLGAHPDAVIRFKTVVGEAAAVRRAAGETGRQKGQGEAAVAELLARLDEITEAPDDPVLLLFEDSDVATKRFVLPGNVHLVSTKAFPIGLERRGFILSAEESLGGHPGSRQNAGCPGTRSAGHGRQPLVRAAVRRPVLAAPDRISRSGPRHGPVLRRWSRTRTPARFARG